MSSMIIEAHVFLFFVFFIMKCTDKLHKTVLVIQGAKMQPSYCLQFCLHGKGTFTLQYLYTLRNAQNSYQQFTLELIINMLGTSDMEAAYSNRPCDVRTELSY